MEHEKAQADPHYLRQHAAMQQAVQAQRVSPAKPLDNIANAARRVDAVCERLNGFLDRFHDRPQAETCAGSADGLIATRIPYSRSLDRLSAIVERLESIAADIDSIG